MVVLNEHRKAVKGAKILILGLAYKPNIDDDRESPSYHLMQKLEGLGAIVSYNDPYIPVIGEKREFSQYVGRRSVEITNDFDLLLISTPHDEYRKMDFGKFSMPILDTRHVISTPGERVYQA
jgi:UDP-N-acetyl-D-glucosamine dehydrogenase